MRKPERQNISRNLVHRPLRNGIDEVVAKLQAAAEDAVAVLYASLFDCSAAVRLRAALAIQELGTISTTARLLEHRIGELERLK
jgi:hypothetical protein